MISTLGWIPNRDKQTKNVKQKWGMKRYNASNCRPIELHLFYPSNGAAFGRASGTFCGKFSDFDFQSRFVFAPSKRLP